MLSLDIMSFTVKGQVKSQAELQTPRIMYSQTMRVAANPQISVPVGREARANPINKG